MGLPVAVVNFDELLSLIGLNKEIEFDTSRLEDLLNEYFPQVIEILRKIQEQQEVKGIQKIKGFYSNGEIIEYITETDILVTGITISQNIFDSHSLDKWNISVSSEQNNFKIIDSLYSKDTLQHKFFEKFYPIPKRYKLTFEPINSTRLDIVYWIDLEYLEVT